MHRTGGQDISFTVVDQAETICPSCGKERDANAVECPFCGIIYDKYKPIEGEKAEPDPEPTIKPVYLSLAQLETFLLSVAQALEAGLSLGNFINGPALRAFPKTLGQRLLEDVEQGVALSRSLASMRLLDASSIAVLHAGELQGKLPEALRVLAARIADQRKDRSRLVMMLVYPGLMLLGSIVVRPLPVIVQKGITGYLGQILFPLVIYAGVCAFIFYVVPRIDPDAATLSLVRRFMLYLPPLSFISWHHAVANFSNTLNECITAGLPVRLALSLATETTKHPTFEKATEALVQKLDEGSPLHEALSSIPRLSANYLALIGHGEQVGKLHEVLPRLTEDHRKRARLLTIATLVGIGLVAVISVFAYLIHAIVQSWTGYMDTLGTQIDALFR